MSEFGDRLDAEARRVAAEPDALASIKNRAHRRRVRRQVGSGVAALAVAGAGFAVAASAFRSGPSFQPRVGPIASSPPACGAPGSITDLSLEPNYVGSNVGERWTAAEGCEVRLDVLMLRKGPGHCGWERATEILMGDPLGTSHNHAPYRIYVRDPENVIGDEEVARLFQPEAKLPSGAQDTGYRQDGSELWMDPMDDRFIYLVSPNGTERWPLDTTPAGCG
jgi:hypothetical protein